MATYRMGDLNLDQGYIRPDYWLQPGLKQNRLEKIRLDWIIGLAHPKFFTKRFLEQKKRRYFRESKFSVEIPSLFKQKVLSILGM